MHTSFRVTGPAWLLSLLMASGCSPGNMGETDPVDSTSASSGTDTATAGATTSTGSASGGASAGSTGNGGAGNGSAGNGGASTGGAGNGGASTGGAGNGGASTGSTSTGSAGSGGGGTGYSLSFPGNGGLDDARVKIRIDDPADNLPGPPLDVGATDFTLEFWMKAAPGSNPNAAVMCGPYYSFVYANIIIDRDRHDVAPGWGLGIAGGVMVFSIVGPFGSYTLCGATPLLDDSWHHVAVQRRRSDGYLWLYIDGDLEDSANGPSGDVSYPDDGVPLNVCPGGSCNYSDPFLVFGREKHGYTDISYKGSLDEVRISTSLRYSASFLPQTTPFVSDLDTAGLFHFDSGSGTTATDSSGFATHGTLLVGGTPSGPSWQAESPF